MQSAQSQSLQLSLQACLEATLVVIVEDPALADYKDKSEPVEADWNHWSPSDLKPYVEIVLEAFGPERCMFGSDWPVCELAASYADVHHALTETVGVLSECERDDLFGGTANRFYRLGL